MSVESDAVSFSNIYLERNYQTRHLLVPTYEIEDERNITIEGAESLQVFTERKDLLTSSFEYGRNGSDPGLVLIFNQEYFDIKTNRAGSRRDVNEIIICMSRLGFNISEKHIFSDLNRDNILNEIKKIVSRDLSQVNCLIVFFLTHGDSYNYLHASDMGIQTHELWKQFVDCPDLKNKPKIFIFQACKGDSFSTISTEVKENAIDLVPDTTFDSEYIAPDMLIVYSTTEGNVSFRDSRTGTWFIQELCKNFSAYGRRDDIISLVIRSTKCICRNYFHYDRDNNKLKKQIPIFVSTLKKKFYLNRNKDRNLYLHLLKEQDSLKRRVEELEKKVNDLLKEKEKSNKQKNN